MKHVHDLTGRGRANRSLRTSATENVEALEDHQSDDEAPEDHDTKPAVDRDLAQD